MPIYEYQCKKCEKIFSVLVMSASAGEPECPSCGSREIKKMMSAFSCTTPSGSTGSGSFPVGGT
jgi:putative FmdB family regulatory protein